MATAFKTEAQPLPFIHPDDMPDMYALTGVGTCMEPLLPDRSLLVFDKREKPKPGELVGLIFTREAARRWGLPGMIKRLHLALPPTELPQGTVGLVVVEQINPPRQYSILSTDLLAVHKCVGTGERSECGRVRFRLPTKREG